MNEVCVWKCGHWCYAHELDHKEEYGVPDIQFEFPFHLPSPVMEALMDTLMPALVRNL